MTEGGVICSNRPKPHEVIGIDKKMAIASKRRKSYIKL